MAIARLALTDFRSHRTLLLELGSGLVVLVGPNGAGKTNILEALSLLAPGRGLRRAPLSEMARTGGKGDFAIAARLADGVELGTGNSPSAPERRIVRINGAPGAATALAERLSLVWLTPAMDRLFVEGASGRRRFLDRLVLALEPGHARQSIRYETAMRERTRLLAQPGPDPAWLDALESAMATHGSVMAAARNRLTSALDAMLAGAPDDVFARPRLTLAGWTEDEPAALAAALREGRGRDAQAGRALAGPHRTDLLVTHLAKAQPADRSSTGEQKAMLLAIVLAHSDLVAHRQGRRPLLLLDEVAAHLDLDRRRALLERLAARGGQAWLTGTESFLFDGAPEPVQRIVLSAQVS